MAFWNLKTREIINRNMLLISGSTNNLKLIVVLVLAYLTSIGLLVAIALVSQKYGIPVSDFTRDPAAILGVHPLIGVLSNIGVLLWCASMALCLFTAVVLFKTKRGISLSFFLSSGLLTALLLVDDLFMLHDYFFPRMLNIEGGVIYVGYLLLVCIYLLKFRGFILKSGFGFLLLSFLFFALSVGCDVLLEQKGMIFLLEDGAKLLGVLSWFTYFSKTCYSEIVAG